MALICKKCGYKQNHSDTIRMMKWKFPGEAEHDIPYYCGACLDTASNEEFDAMWDEMHPNEGDYKTDKKKNAQYWDGIDESIYDCIKDIAVASSVPVNEDTLEANIYDFVSETREVIIKCLTEIGCVFPYVDEDY